MFPRSLENFIFPPLFPIYKFLCSLQRFDKVPFNTLLHESFATRLFRDFEVRIFRDT